MASNITITIKRKLTLAGYRYRWTAVSANGKKLAGGQGYKHKHDVEHVLHLLYGPKFNGHKINDQTAKPA